MTYIIISILFKHGNGERIGLRGTQYNKNKNVDIQHNLTDLEIPPINNSQTFMKGKQASDKTTRMKPRKNRALGRMY